MRRLVLYTLAGVFCLTACLKPVFAAEESKAAEILKRLDEISEDQKEIKAQLEDMKKELYIIKIRATKK